MNITDFLNASKPTKFDYLGTECQAYPLSAACIFKLRKVAPHISEALSTIFQKTDNDVSHKYSSLKDNETQSIENSSEAVSPEILRIRSEQKTKAINGIISFFLSDDSAGLLIDVMWSGLRLGKDKKPVTAEAMQETLSDFTVEEILAMLKGIFEANKRILGPFSDTLARISESAKEIVEKKLAPERTEDLGTDGGE